LAEGNTARSKKTQSSNTRQQQLSGMNKILVITSALVLCVVLVLAAGCTQPATPVATPTPTPAITSAVPTPTASLTSGSSTPGPTQTLPPYWAIEVEVKSNGFSPDPQIITTVRGGQGLNFIQLIDVKVTRSDGIVETGNIPKPLKVGDSVSLASTTAPGYADRAEVWATDPQGTKVKIFDDYVPFRTYN
jgi:hypothetical protein